MGSAGLRTNGQKVFRFNFKENNQLFIIWWNDSFWPIDDKYIIWFHVCAPTTKRICYALNLVWEYTERAKSIFRLPIYIVICDRRKQMGNQFLSFLSVSRRCFFFIFLSNKHFKSHDEWRKRCQMGIVLFIRTGVCNKCIHKKDLTLSTQ